jgi:hypothetical protein
MKLTVKKQSLQDWSVEDEKGKTQAWIKRSWVKGGGRYCFEVTFRLFNFEGPYVFGSFREAKASATSAINIGE